MRFEGQSTEQELAASSDDLRASEAGANPPGGASFWIPDLFNGAALVIAVGLSGLTVRRRRARANEQERAEPFAARARSDGPSGIAQPDGEKTATTGRLDRAAEPEEASNLSSDLDHADWRRL